MPVVVISAVTGDSEDYQQFSVKLVRNSIWKLLDESCSSFTSNDVSAFWEFQNPLNAVIYGSLEALTETGSFPFVVADGF